MSRVNEEKLGALEPEKIRLLMERKSMAHVYAHLASLGNFQRLLDRRASLTKQAGQPQT
jgi:hypothetical protein